MNPSLLFHFFIFFTVYTTKAFSSSSSISYSDHCNSYAPEANPTDRLFNRNLFLEQVTTHYTGGKNIFDQDPPSKRSIFFESTDNVFATNVVGTLKIQASLRFYSSYYFTSNFTTTRSNYSRAGWKYRRTLVFYLDGFWSVSTNKLCMVGSARWFTKEGNPLTLNVVLKLKSAMYLTLDNSLVSGTLESLASPDDSDYFEPVSLLGFPQVVPYRYNYTFASNETCDVIKTKTLLGILSLFVEA